MQKVRGPLNTHPEGMGKSKKGTPQDKADKPGLLKRFWKWIVTGAAASGQNGPCPT